MLHEATSGRRMRALLVDDNRDAADTLAVLAGLWGHEVRTAYDGKTALEVAKVFHPDCFVLDLQMPGLDGYAVARRVREDPGLRTARLVALSANEGDIHLSRVRDAGFDYSLTKPADLGELERLFRMLAQALKLAERTETLAQQNVRLAEETKELLTEVKEELREVKQEIREVKEEIREIREEPR